jgi:hypothetical protein
MTPRSGSMSRADRGPCPRFGRGGAGLPLQTVEGRGGSRQRERDVPMSVSSSPRDVTTRKPSTLGIRAMCS